MDSGSSRQLLRPHWGESLPIAANRILDVISVYTHNSVNECNDSITMSAMLGHKRLVCLRRRPIAATGVYRVDLIVPGALRCYNIWVSPSPASLEGDCHDKNQQGPRAPSRLPVREQSVIVRIRLSILRQNRSVNDHGPGRLFSDCEQ